MATKNAQKNQLPIWIWLLTCLALAGLIMFLILLGRLQPPQYSDGQTATIEDTGTYTKQENHYDFYTTLKNTVIPVEADENDKKPKKAAEEVIFLLQVASFRELTDARQVQAELILLGLKSTIEESRNDSGQVWHRVISGPFENRSKQQRARSILLSNRYSPMVIKRKISKKL